MTDARDSIEVALDQIFADFRRPPTERDLRGIDPATFAIGIGYGFTDLAAAAVAKNSRRLLRMAATHWTKAHPSADFLAAAAGTDELSMAHRELLTLAHPNCDSCKPLYVPNLAP
jgi:hypothetical protein